MIPGRIRTSRRVRSLGQVAAIVLATLVALVPANGVNADEQTREDPGAEAPGPLDIRSIGHSHEDRGLLVHSATTAESWSSSILQGGASTIEWFFLVKGEVRRAGITKAAEDGTLYTEMIRWPTNRILGFAKTWKPDEQTIQVEFPRRLLGRGVEKYRWYVQTIFHQPDHPECGDAGGVRTKCYDRAPDRGSLGHSIAT